MRSSLGRSFGVQLEVRLEKVEELTCNLLIEALPEHAYANVLDLTPVEDRGMLLLDGGLCLALVDRVLGGDGENLPQPRPLTAVDQAAVDGPVQMILRAMQGAWNNLCEIEMNVAERANDVSRLRLADPAKAMLVVTMSLSGDLGDGRFRLCLPVAGLKRALDSTVERNISEQSGPERAAAVRTTMVRALGEVALPVTACIGKGEVSIRHLTRLRPGDVVRIHRAADSAVVLHVDGRPRFLVKMGLQGRKKAVQILERIQPA